MFHLDFEAQNGAECPVVLFFYIILMSASHRNKVKRSRVLTQGCRLVYLSKIRAI